MIIIILDGDGALSNMPLWVKIGLMFLSISPFMAMWIYWRRH